MAKKKSASKRPTPKKAPKLKAKADPIMSLFHSWVENGWLHLEIVMDKKEMIVRVDADLCFLDQLSESVDECRTLMDEEEDLE